MTVRSKIMKHLSGLPGVSTWATSIWLLLEGAEDDVHISLVDLFVLDLSY